MFTIKLSVFIINVAWIKLINCTQVYEKLIIRSAAKSEKFKLQSEVAEITVTLLFIKYIFENLLTIITENY